MANTTDIREMQILFNKLNVSISTHGDDDSKELIAQIVKRIPFNSVPYNTYNNVYKHLQFVNLMLKKDYHFNKVAPVYNNEYRLNALKFLDTIQEIIKIEISHMNTKMICKRLSDESATQESIGALYTLPIGCLRQIVSSF